VAGTLLKNLLPVQILKKLEQEGDLDMGQNASLCEKLMKVLNRELSAN
jgi:hypothetical protein